MKKLLITLLSVLFFVSGCSITKISNNSVDDVFKTVLYVNNDLSNTFFSGYKFYLPQGVKVIDKNDYNIKIKDRRSYYHLYIDTIAYYYKTQNNYKIDDTHFYSSKITNGDITGYLDIEEIGDKYFIVLMYNYAKIEAYISKDDFNESFTNMCYILSTIEFNDKVIVDYIGKKTTISQEEKFDIFSSKRENDNFLTYEQEYGTYKDDQSNSNVDDDGTVIIDTIE